MNHRIIGRAMAVILAATMVLPTSACSTTTENIAIKAEQKVDDAANTFVPEKNEEPAVSTQIPEEQVEPAEPCPDVRITEVMTANKTVLQSPDGEFRDWIELHNLSDFAANLEGYRLSNGNHYRKIPSCSIEPNGYKVIFFADRSDTDSAIEPLQADFHISAEDTIFLYSPEMEELDRIELRDLPDNTSLICQEDGTCKIWNYPTPGYENTLEAYAAIQDSLVTDSPLVIYEAATWNNTVYQHVKTGEYPDWVELKNNSDAPIQLSDYYLTNKQKELERYQLPAQMLGAGETAVILCTDKFDQYYDYAIAPFGLDSENESLFLTNGEKILDRVSLKAIPYQGSYGRMDGQNGYFYFSNPTPGKPNGTDGCRYVCEKPESQTRPGQYQDVESVTVELTATGEIYYTLDGTLPTRESLRYAEPITLTSTGMIRAISSDGCGMDSRPITLNYFINEGITIPIVSVVADDPKQLKDLYDHSFADIEVPGNISYYDGVEYYSVDCGLYLSGKGTLRSCKKRNITARFRGVYGSKFWEYKLFDGPIDRYSSLILRGGHDYNRAIIRNELFENLCYQSTEHLITQQSQYVILYVNGEYFGIYSLIERINKQLISDYTGFDKDSIVIQPGPVEGNGDLATQVIYPILRDGIENEDVYNAVAEHMDMDSLIDWYALRGHSGDVDIVFNNVRFWKSNDPASDGRWHLLYFDLDAALRYADSVYYNVARMRVEDNQYVQMFFQLQENAVFKEAFLTRVNELLQTTLSDEQIRAEIERLYTILEPEIPRNLVRWDMNENTFAEEQATLYGFVENDFLSHLCVERIAQYFELSPEEIAQYFPTFA